MRGEYYHFRCAQHEVDAASAVQVWPASHSPYRCEVKGCDRPAKCYWYRGEQFQKLNAVAPATSLDKWDMWVCG